MSNWGFWEWLTYSCIGVAALALASDQAIKGSPEMTKQFSSLLSAPIWNYAPLVLIAVSGILILGHQFGILGSRTKTTEAPNEQTQFIETSLRLQFFGDRRTPHDVGQSNVINWVSYYSPSIRMIPRDANGEIIPGTMETSPNWVIFLVFDKPVNYRQTIVNFSNPEIAPPIHVGNETMRSLFIRTDGMIPAGVLSINLVK